MLRTAQPEKAPSSSAGSGEHKVEEAGSKKEATAPASPVSGPSTSTLNNTRVKHPHKDSTKSGQGKRLHAPTSSKVHGALKAPPQRQTTLAGAAAGGGRRFSNPVKMASLGSFVEKHPIKKLVDPSEAGKQSHGRARQAPTPSSLRPSTSPLSAEEPMSAGSFGSSPQATPGSFSVSPEPIAASEGLDDALVYSPDAAADQDPREVADDVIPVASFSAALDGHADVILEEPLESSQVLAVAATTDYEATEPLQVRREMTFALDMDSAPQHVLTPDPSPGRFTLGPMLQFEPSQVPSLFSAPSEDQAQNDESFGHDN